MQEDYLRARRLGAKAYRRDIISGTSLPALDELLGNEYGQEINLGLVEIPISTIIGTKTKSRQNAFASNFMPILEADTEFAMKWSSLYDSAIDEGIREQIICYEYMRKFYVQEGNKRVSVSRYLGIEEILANVTRIMPLKDGSPEVDRYYEFIDFYQVCPLYDIEFSKSGDYERLASMIGMDLSHVWSKDTVRDLRFAYNTFAKIFREKGGDKLNMTAGDAFLVYLDVYGTESLLHESTSLLETQVGKVWNEILLASNDDKIDLVETPEEAPKEAPNLISAIIAQSQVKVYTKDDPLRVAFIYNSNAEHSSWIYGHELGRMDLTQRFGGAIETIKFENCKTDEEVRHAIDIASIDEDSIIITVSPTQMAETLKSAIHYPEIQFLNCSINLSHNAVQTYYVRLYEAKFLMGVLAGSLAENHKIGYRAAHPTYGALADINAFAIGAALADPLAKVYLSWSSVDETNWQEQFEAEGIRIISGPNFIQPDQASREYGVYLIDEAHNITNLAVPIINWGKYYDQMLRPIVDGVTPFKLPLKKAQAVNYWWGMSAGVVDIILGNKVSYYSKKMIDLLKDAVKSGRLNPFDGEIRSQSGIVKTADAPRLSNQEIIAMNYLNDNVIGTIPTFDELTPAGKRAVQVSGIIDAGNGSKKA